MRLRDLELQTTHNTATHYKRSKEFNLGVNFIEDLYLQQLVFKTKDTAKVCVQLEHDPQSSLYDAHGNIALISLEKEQLMDIFVCTYSFNFDHYFQQSLFDRKYLALQTLQFGLIEVSNLKGWKTDIFLDAYSKVLETKIVNEGFMCNFKKSPDGQYYTRSFYQFDSDSYDLLIVLYDSKKHELDRKVVYSSEPLNNDYRYLYGKHFWENETTFVIESKDGYERFVLSI